MVQAKSKINFSWARFLGLLQSDGCALYFWDKSGRGARTFHPKIIITQGIHALPYLVDVIQPWLDKQGINNSIQERDSDKGISYNLIIDRQTNIKKVLANIRTATQNLPTLLVDSRLVSLLSVEYAQKEWEASKQFPQARKDQIRKVLIDLKLILRKEISNPSPSVLAQERAEMESLFGFKNTQGQGQAIYNSLLKQANTKGKELISEIKAKKYSFKNCPKNLQEYLAGLIEGDCSFQVNFFTRVKNNKRAYEFKPMFTLTNGYVLTDKQYTMEIVNALLNSNVGAQLVGKNVKAVRLYVKPLKDVSAIAQFSDKVGINLLGKYNRLQTLLFVLNKGNQLYTDKKLALYVISLISKYFSKYRKYTPSQCRQIIEAYFKP